MVGFGLEADRDMEKGLGGPEDGGDMETPVVGFAEGMIGGLLNSILGHEERIGDSVMAGITLTLLGVYKSAKLR